MDIMAFIELVLEYMAEYIEVTVLGICLSIGFIIKHSIPVIPNRYIPLIMGVLGVVLAVWISEWTFTPEVLLVGLVSGLSATGTHQAIKVFRKKQEE